ncbi:MAG: ERF family protein [Clostridiales bacterium]|nr:ERF family protein [Clostridiales bacterium]MBQ1572115.1 ERF family protein [Clostridiales bacterium]
MAEKTPMNLTTKLMHIQTELKAPKNLYNSFGKYKYRNAESILEALKPLEAKYKVAVVIEDEITEVSSRIYVKTTVKLFDTESDDHIVTSAYAREADVKKGMDEAQVTGATSSYSRKYALNALFLLDDTKDVDTEEYQSQKKESKPATAPASADRNIRQELVNYCNELGIDPREVARTYKLNNSSTDEEFKTVIGRLVEEHMRGGI